MSHSRNINTNNPLDKSRTDAQGSPGLATLDVTVSKKSSEINEQENVCSGQRSFISIHSTDHLCQIQQPESTSKLAECNLEVLSIKEAFPSTSEESLVNDEDETPRKTNKIKQIPIQTPKSLTETTKPYTPSNSKSTTNSGRSRREQAPESQPTGYSDYDIPKNTLYVIGSNPGEPKMCYTDPPKKISKTMKKFLRNIDKHKNEQNSKNTEKTISKLTMRGILKDGGCFPESTGDTLQSLQNSEQDTAGSEQSLGFSMDFVTPHSFCKHGNNPDKNVTFNTQVIIIHFTGDLCVGQSVETLSKEKDQQARNSELRKTFLTKYNEFWPTQK